MKRLVAALILIFAAVSVRAITLGEAALQIEKRLRSLKSLQAEFEHQYFSTTVSEPLLEKGRFFFMKPDMMRWDSKTPEEQTFLYKGGQFLLYIPEENQLIRSRNSTKKFESEILALFSGSKAISDSYTIESSPFPTENARAVQIKLVPKQEGEFSYILLETDPENWLIQKAVFFDWAGNKQEFLFRRIKVDARLPKSIFELKIPPGCEVIEESAAADH